MNMQIRNTVGVVVLASLIIGSLGFFHFFTDHLFLIPKEHFTFSMTFTTIDEVVMRYNGRAIGDRVRGNILLDHLVSELQAKEFISTTSVEPLLGDKLGF